MFRGNDVKDQSWEVAMFQEMAATPTTLEASRYSDLLGCFPGNSVEGRDVEQAYLQADMEGAPLISCFLRSSGLLRCIK